MNAEKSPTIHVAAPRVNARAPHSWRLIASRVPWRSHYSLSRGTTVAPRTPRPWPPPRSPSKDRIRKLSYETATRIPSVASTCRRMNQHANWCRATKSSLNSKAACCERPGSAQAARASARNLGANSPRMRASSSTTAKLTTCTALSSDPSVA